MAQICRGGEALSTVCVRIFIVPGTDGFYLRRTTARVFELTQMLQQQFAATLNCQLEKAKEARYFHNPNETHGRNSWTC